MFESHITLKVHGILKDYIKEGHVVVDATMGNGYDTVFLAEQVGVSGKVYAFDIQEKALLSTKEKLVESNLSDRVTLIKASHEAVRSHVQEPIDMAMFNLGYLPTGNKEVITKPYSTLIAIEAILGILKKDGILSIITYYGHDGGMVEKEAVQGFISMLKQSEYEVLSIQYENRKKNPPIIYFVRKRV
ncbi:methyltransferase domain-containing protein [Vallitalea pronyensis]|uniref:Methyltransferase domain-containing protein n=2 Tax=Vallitalea pronyensis TaxID=1348613 RepID=A0A8J8MP73_9FIRM|nr:methyltransferase domain-containing protein [Vallitalea pronyensis]